MEGSLAHPDQDDIPYSHQSDVLRPGQDLATARGHPVEGGGEVRRDVAHDRLHVLVEHVRVDVRVRAATEQDWHEEYLDLTLAVKIVKNIDEALDHIAQYGSKHTEAIVTLDEGLASYPADTLLWNNRGVALEKLGKSEEALAAYDKAVSFDQNYTLGYVNKGILLNKMGRYSEAVVAYSQANETKPFNEDILAGLEEAKKGEASSARTTTILLAIVLVAVIGIVVWYVKFRKPAEPEPESKKKKSKKK